MTSYFVQGFISILSIIFLSNLINLKLNIKIKETFFLSIIFISLFIFIGYFLNSIIYFIFIIFLISLISLYYFENIKKNTLINFVFIFIATVFLCLNFDLFYNDEDELAYWGIKLKFFHIFHGNLLKDFKEFLPNYGSRNIIHSYNYHPPGLTNFQFYNSYLSPNNFIQLSIFSNNLILISVFFYIFYNSNNFYNLILKFIIFYLLLNCLSFGMISIYPDVILGTVFFILIFKINQRNFLNIKEFSIFILICIYFLTIHNSAVLYLLVILIYISSNYLFEKKNFNLTLNHKLTFLIIFSLIFFLIKFSSYFINPFNILINIDFAETFIKFYFVLINSPIYFSELFVLFNKIANILGQNMNFINLKLNSIYFIILLFITYRFTDLTKRNLILFFIGFFVISFSIVIFKIQYQSLSYLVYGRYIAIFFLAYFLFVFYHLFKKTSFINNLCIILIMLFLAPSKIFTIIVPKNIYLKDKQNLFFYENKKKIKNLKLNDLRNGEVCLIYNKNIHHQNHSLYKSLIKFHLYPLQFEENCYNYEKNKYELKKNKNITKYFLLNISENEIPIMKDLNFIKLQY